jgi:hypothetical protein
MPTLPPVMTAALPFNPSSIVRVSLFLGAADQSPLRRRMVKL